MSPCRPCYHALVLTAPSLWTPHTLFVAPFFPLPPLKVSAPAHSALLCSYTVPSRTSSPLYSLLPPRPLPSPLPGSPQEPRLVHSGPKDHLTGLACSTGICWRIAHRLVLLWNTHCKHPARTVQFLIKATVVSPRFFCHLASSFLVQSTTRSLISRPIDRKTDRFVVFKFALLPRHSPLARCVFVKLKRLVVLR